MKSAIVLSILVVFLELAGLSISISDRKWLIFAFYTQISNIIACLSSMAFVLNPDAGWVAVFRFTSSCMLTMTFLVTAFVLVPMGGGFRKLMLSGNGLYHHTLCPAISVLCYIFLEPHIRSAAWIALPAAITLIYGLAMLTMNAKRKFDGPYPFFKVYQQTRTATVLWMLALMAVISGIAAIIYNV